MENNLKKQRQVMINTIADRKNLYKNLEDLDIIKDIKPLLERGGYHIRAEDSKIVPINASIHHDAPWVYVQSLPSSRCDIYQRVFFQHFHHIPSHCRSCWKVVVRPKTVEQLFDLYEVQRVMGVPCKCGLEVRDTVHGNYGGYFYTRSKEEGLERYEIVRHLVTEHLGEDVDVLLKRYCTEYEIGPGSFGDSSKMVDATKSDLALEEYIETHLPATVVAPAQAKHVVANVMRRWIEYAYKIGDPTYKLFTGGERLYPKYTTYHENNDLTSKA